jgi:hypothetical protein
LISYLTEKSCWSQKSKIFNILLPQTRLSVIFFNSFLNLSESISPIIIDNTNLLYWEIKNYLNIAKNFDYIVILIEPRTAKKFDPIHLSSNCE